MTDPVEPLISELVDAANEADKLTLIERSRLLRRGAGRIQQIRDRINFGETPAKDPGPGDIVFDLNEMAETVDSINDADIAEALLDIVETIKAGLILLEAKRALGADE